MAKEVRRETTVTFRCDGCGKEDFVIGEFINENSLPKGWGVILWCEEFVPTVTRTGGSFGSPEYEGRSRTPFRLILCCHLCAKKMVEVFRSKDAPAPNPAPPASQEAVVPWWRRWLS